MKTWGLLTSTILLVVVAGLVRADELGERFGPSFEVPAVPGPPTEVPPLAPGPPSYAAPVVPCPQPTFPAPGGLFAHLLGNDGGPAREQFWFRSEILLWWIKDGPRSIPLGTTGPAPASGLTPLPGFLGEPGTRIILGDEPTSYGLRTGVRYTAGFWLDESKRFGLEANYLFLHGSPVQAAVHTTGQPGTRNLAIPYHDVTGAAVTPLLQPQNGVPGEAVWALPGPLHGFRGFLSNSRQSWLQGAELNGLFSVVDRQDVHISALTGFRWLQLNENETFDFGSRGVSGGAAQGQFFNSEDVFITRNNFFGGNIGAKGEYCVGAWSFQGTAEVAFGVMQENALVSGFSRTSNGTINYPTVGTGSQVLPGGIFAQRTNGGHHNTNQFAVVPEATCRVAYQLTKAVQVSVGYTFLFASAVARPEDLVNRRINSTLTGLADASRASGGSHTPPGGPPQPAFHWQDSVFWAQGINLAVEARF